MEKSDPKLDTVMGYSKEQIEQELFGDSVYGEVYLGEYRSGAVQSGDDYADAVSRINCLMQQLDIEHSDGTWAKFVDWVSTSRGKWPEEQTAELRQQMTSNAVTPGHVLSSLLYRDYDIEGEPESGDGSVSICIKLPDGRTFLLSGEGDYWTERDYITTDGSPFDTRMGENDILEAEEAGLIKLENSDIFWKSNFHASSYSAG